MENVEKVAKYLIILFHGVVTAYLLKSLTDIELSDAHFIILIIFCAYLNIILARVLAYLGLSVAMAHQDLRLTADRHSDDAKAKLEQLAQWRRGLFNGSTLDLSKAPALSYFVGYLMVSLLSAGILAAGYDYDWPIAPYHQLFSWARAHLNDPLGVYFFYNCNVDGNCSDAPATDYLEIWYSDGQSITAGRLADAPFGNEKRIVQLSAACHIIFDKSTLSFFGVP
jgi:hypothetical protein